MRHAPPAARAWILAYPDASAAEAAAALGLSIQSARDYRHRLIRDGELRPMYPRIDLSIVQEAVEDGLLAREIAKDYGLSESALRGRLRRNDMAIQCVRDGTVYSGRDIGRILGLSSATTCKKIRRWRKAGLLEAKKSRHRHSPYRIPVTSWIAFLEQPRCPVQPEDIACPEWRMWAEGRRDRAHLRG